MKTRDILFKYLVNFRVESNRRMSMISGVPVEIPFYIYEGAHEAAREATVSQLELSPDGNAVEKMDKLYEVFMMTFRENKHYSDTDDLILEAIENGEFD